MAKIIKEVTIVSLPFHPGGKYLSVGSHVTLSHEPENEKDKNAHRVDILPPGNVVPILAGYVANNPHTVVPNTISANELLKLNESYQYSEIVATVVRTDQVVMSNNKTATVYIARFELKGEEAVKEEQTNQKSMEFTFKIMGGKTRYPNKLAIGEALDLGEIPVVKVELRDDKHVVLFQNDLAGYVSEKEEDGLSSFEEMAPFLNGREAMVISRKGNAYIASFTVSEAEKKRLEGISVSIEAMNRAVNKGLVEKGNAQEILDYLIDNNLNEVQIASVFDSYKEYDEEAASYIPSKPEKLYIDPNEGEFVQSAIAYIGLGKNLLLEGDKATGKNTLTITLAWVLQRPLYEVSLNSAYDNTSLMGAKQIDMDDDGKLFTSFDKETIVKAAEVGGIVVLDEINTALANVMSLLNSLLDDRRRITVPGLGRVDADENFVAIGTMNRDYQGTFDLNEATADRFVPLIFPAPKSIAKIIEANVPEADAYVISTIDRVFQHAMKNVQDGQIDSEAISVRGLSATADVATNMGLPLKLALMHNVANKASDPEDRKILTNIIDDILG